MNTLDQASIGFIGLGLMGRPMCLNLHRAGARLFVYNRSRQVIDAVEQPGILPVDTPAELPGHARTVILMVSDTPAVEQVLFGAGGLSGHVSEDTLIIDMGTTAAAPTREFARRLRDQGADYIDAPVSGGEVGARNATLTIMAGGSTSAIERARPIFCALGSSFTHIGEVGAGQVAKAANQVIVGLTIGAVAEALALVRSAGVDPGKAREALLGGFAASRILELHGQRMLDDDFRPGGKVITQHKDLEQALELAAAAGLDLPATQLNRSMYQQLIDAGHGDLDHSALFRLYDGC